MTNRLSLGIVIYVDTHLIKLINFDRLSIIRQFINYRSEIVANINGVIRINQTMFSKVFICHEVTKIFCFCCMDGFQFYDVGLGGG